MKYPEPVVGLTLKVLVADYMLLVAHIDVRRQVAPATHLVYAWVGGPAQVEESGLKAAILS